MVSQADSNVSKLHRSKSATSVKERRKHPIPPNQPDPETSRVHALIAAHRAVDRSRSRSSGDLRRTESSASAKSTRTARQSNIRFSPSTQLRRQRSLLQSRAPHLASKLQNPSGYQEDDETLLSDLGLGSENYGAEPSSYRRVRRTKSMNTPRRRLFSNTTSPGHTPLSQAVTLRHATSSATLHQPSMGLRLRRSLHALRPSTRFSLSRRQEPQPELHEEAVQIARAQYLSDMQEQEATKPSSLTLRSRPRKESKPFRTSLRSNQLKDTESSLASEQLLKVVNGTAKRSFSATLRDRFKRAFGKTIPSHDTIPSQQVQATRQHFSDEHNTIITNNSFDQYQIEPEESRRTSFYVPSGPHVDSQEELDKFSPTMYPVDSRDSLHSNAKSRVTSWTNSSMTGSTTQSGLERNRLSIIKEDGGPHQPSSSAGRHLGGIDSFQVPLPTENEYGQPLQPPNSQRIYSALMRRIGEEEAEMQQTEAALEKINADRGSTVLAHDTSISTIRAVSRSTLAADDTDDKDFRCLDDNPWRKENSSSITPTKHNQDLTGKKQKRPIFDEQSSFFPFSDQQKSSTPSPFRKLLEKRKSQEKSDDASTFGPEDDGVGFVHAPKPSRPITRGQWGVSSDSVYSRMTNGDTNPEYRPPLASSEDLHPMTEVIHMETGMATILSSDYRPLTATRPKLVSAAGSSDREFRGWVEGQVQSLGRRDSKTSYHVREHAQIDPDDVQVGKNVFDYGLSSDATAQNSPLLELKNVQSNTPGMPNRRLGLAKSQSGFLNKTTSGDFTSNLGYGDENRKVSHGLRKISPGNIARMIRERKSQMLTSKPEDIGKENKPSRGDGSPPISTPGRLHLQMRSGNGRLRKRASEAGMKPKQIADITPKHVSTPLQPKVNVVEQSPTDRVKQSLSARLSRPFNMDVPEYNRPFDSMYLGKGEANFATGARLSVAPHTNTRSSKGYGSLGADPFDGEQDTALPHVSTPSPVNSKMAGLWTSKRMVSDFLRRRRERTTSGKADEGSPAFL